MNARRPGFRLRTLFLALGVLVVSAAYVLLLTASETVVVRVEGDLQRHWQVPFHLIVRSPDHVLPWEKAWGLTRIHDMVTLPPGMTLEQYRTIREIPGVEVAAPISVVGYFLSRLNWDTFLSGEGWYRVQWEYALDRGPFVYRYIDQQEPPYAWLVDWEHLQATAPALASELLTWLDPQKDAYPEALRPLLRIIPRLSPYAEAKGTPFRWKVNLRIPLLLVGVDFAAEDRLTGLGRAVKGLDPRQIQGYCRFPPRIQTLAQQLPESMKASASEESSFVELPVFVIPVVFLGSLPVDLDVSLHLIRLRAPESPEALIWDLQAHGEEALARLEPLEERTFSQSLQEAYRQYYAGRESGSFRYFTGEVFWAEQPLTEETCANPGVPLSLDPAYPWGVGPPVWKGMGQTTAHITFNGKELRVDLTEAPGGLNPLQERTVREGAAVPVALVKPVIYAFYRPEDLPLITDPLTMTAIGLYRVPPVRVLAMNGQALEHPQYLRPNLTPLGYLPPPPAMLTTLEAACALLGDPCISVIRVRVAGVETFSPQTQAKIEAVAAEIVRRTGLHVDVVAGASVRPVQVHLPGDGERFPDLVVEEPWLQKGVHLTIRRTVQRGNRQLFGVMLVLALVYTFNTGTIWIMQDMWKWALVRALGWREGTVYVRLVLRAVGVGLVAGLAGAALAWGVTELGGWAVPGARLLLIVPLSTALVGLGVALPALEAIRVPPLPVLQGRWGMAAQVPRRWAWLGLPARHPREMLLAVLASAGATWLLAMVVGAWWGLRGYLSLTLLGQYLLVRLQAEHGVLVGVSLLVAGLAILDVVLLLMQRYGYLTGLFLAFGWRPREVFRFWLRQGWMLGALGGTAGGLLGLLTLVMGDGFRAAYLAGFGVAGLMGPALGALAAWVPAWWASRQTPAEILRRG